MQRPFHALWSGMLLAGMLACSSGHASGSGDMATPASPSVAVESQSLAASASDPCPPRGAPIQEPYTWYPALDLARVPFHKASGPWGARAPITAPAAPITKRTVTVETAQQFQEAALNPGTQIVVGRSITEAMVVFGDVIDIDIVVPKDKRIASVVFGSYSPPSKTERVRVRGSTPMTRSGGTAGSLSFLSARSSDVIIDGLDLNGEDGKGGDGLWTFRAGERFAIVHVRGHAVGWGTLLGDTTDVVIAGSNFVTGARTRTLNGYPEGWDIRGGDRVVYFHNYFSGSRYHRIRVHPEPGPAQYAFIAENVFIDPYEARIVSAFDLQGSTSHGFAALWAQCNVIYAHSTCMSPSFEAPAAAYAQLTHNTFYGSATKAQQKDLQKRHGENRDYLKGNTFHAWKAPPAPPPPGDPRAIPLPADDPTDNKSGLEGAACPGP